MSKNLYLVVGLCVVLVFFLFLGFKYSPHKTYYSGNDDSVVDIDITNTQWELVEFSENGTTQNLVGTDWGIDFAYDSGILHLCDDHVFDFYNYKNTLNFSFKNKIESSCQQNNKTDERVYLDIFNSNPVVDRVASPDKNFQEVMTLVANNKKLVFIYRPSVVVSNSQTKKVIFKTDIPYTGMFDIVTINDQGIQSEVVQKLDIQNSESQISLPKGTYQIKISKIEKNIVFLPILFSIADTDDNPYVITLKISQNK